MVKVARALVEEGHAEWRQRRLYLRDAMGLLGDWIGEYPGPIQQIDLYFRGDVATAEESLCRACRSHDVRHALAGFSAGWRLAPEVRYATAALYVEDRAFEPVLLESLVADSGGTLVDSGPNLLLWRAYDPSVFAGSGPHGASDLPVTSALQTYLDLRGSPGRGEDAAMAVYKAYLEASLRETSPASERSR